jgi:membrane fusion protein, multidrug efflux system
MPTPETITSEPAGQPVPSTTATATTPGADAALQLTPPAPILTPPAPMTPATRPHRARRWWWVLGGVGLLGALLAGMPWLVRSWQTVSTDDAYVNGYVTFVAPRVAGQIARVLVEDNNRVRQGDLLVQLDPEPYQVQVDIAQAAVVAAPADLVAAQAQVRSTQGQIRSSRFTLERAIEDVHNQLALLRSKVAI